MLLVEQHEPPRQPYRPGGSTRGGLWQKADAAATPADRSTRSRSDGTRRRASAYRARRPSFSAGHPLRRIGDGGAAAVSPVL